MLRIKHAYAPPEPSDGLRVLVDRLWPRGLRKDAAHLDAWQKDLAPSDALRKWFGHEPERWAEFRTRYRRELGAAAQSALLDDLARRAKRSTVTLVFAAHDLERNNAVVLRAVLERRIRTPVRPKGAASKRRK